MRVRAHGRRINQLALLAVATAATAVAVASLPPSSGAAYAAAAAAQRYESPGPAAARSRATSAHGRKQHADERRERAGAGKRPAHASKRSAHASKRSAHASKRSAHASKRSAHASKRSAHISKRSAHASKQNAQKGKPLQVLVDLTRLRKRGRVTAADLAHYRGVYMQALRSVRNLTGTRRTELFNVISNVNAIAAANGLIPSRLPALFLTLQRNVQWWTTGRLLSYGQRVSFKGSRLVWEYYPGQGIELQWLATFGEANGYYLAGDENEALREVLEQASALATNRARGLAWEYLFHFDGGSPPWTSGLSQGTALQAFARGATRLHEPAFAQIAERALGVFETPPPAGVRVARTVNGAPAAEYLEYSFAPSERIINGFIQAVTGLYDFTKLTGSQQGLRLFEEGDLEARTQVPRYNTGAWSMYDQHTESDLGYHELLAEFLQNLCSRTQHGLPLSTPAPPSETPPASPPTPEGSPTGGTGAGGSGPTVPGEQSGSGSLLSGGEASGAGSGSAAGDKRENVKAAASTAGSNAASGAEGGERQASAPIGGDEIYCSTAESFSEDLTTAPKLKLLSKKLSASFHAGVMFSLSKVATISLTVRKGKKVIWSNKATVEAGKPRLLWITPKQRGAYTVSATAVDLAGNTSSTSGVVRLTARRH